MLGAKNLSIADERSIIGSYKADELKDPDSIYARKTELIRLLKGLKIIVWMGYLFSPLGLLMFIFPGAIMIGGATWALLYMKKKIKLIESATEKYCKELGIEPV